MSGAPRTSPGDPGLNPEQLQRLEGLLHDVDRALRGDSHLGGRRGILPTIAEHYQAIVEVKERLDTLSAGLQDAQEQLRPLVEASGKRGRLGETVQVTLVSATVTAMLNLVFFALTYYLTQAS